MFADTGAMQDVIIIIILSMCCSDGRSSDQIALEIAADMTRSLPMDIDIYDEDICASLKLLTPLSLADIAKIGMSTDMAFARTKYKEPVQSKKEKGWQLTKSH